MSGKSVPQALNVPAGKEHYSGSEKVGVPVVDRSVRVVVEVGAKGLGKFLDGR